jgi:uncharacterized glyoxalase superfamily metalloenzyme YdcJ
MSRHVETWQLRARFAAALPRMYGTEVPAYTTLVQFSAVVNRDCVADMADASDNSRQRMTDQIAHRIDDSYELHEKDAS